MKHPDKCETPEELEDLMPCGECCVCSEYLDHSDAGFCETCNQGFHWGMCGDWYEGKHCCEECNPQLS